MNLLEQIPRPDHGSINSGLSACKADTLRRWLGEPRINKDYNAEGSEPTNKRILSLLTQAKLGHFRVRCLKPLAERLTAGYAEILARGANWNIKPEQRQMYQELASKLGTAGALNVRYVRGSHTTLSNHSWGTAIDFTFAGKLDARGDGMVYQFELELYKIFKDLRLGIFWGAGFSTEDGMHFELADETITDIGRSGGFK